jgi:hypothetical protein
MEMYCSTGESPQQAAAPTEEEEEVLFVLRNRNGRNLKQIALHHPATKFST